MKGNSFKTPAEGIRAQIQHLQAYASTDKLQNRCVDPRYTYVNRGCAEYVEHLGTHENPKSQGWASGQNYGQKIINILNSILSIKTEKENDIMNINTSFISNNNSYAGQTPVYIVIHNTDNYAKEQMQKHTQRPSMMEILKAIPRMYSLMIQKHTRHFRMIVARGM